MALKKLTFSKLVKAFTVTYNKILPNAGQNKTKSFVLAKIIINSDLVCNLVIGVKLPRPPMGQLFFEKYKFLRQAFDKFLTNFYTNFFNKFIYENQIFFSRNGISAYI